MSTPTRPRVGGSFTSAQLDKIAYLQAGLPVPEELASVEVPPEFEPPADPNDESEPGDEPPHDGGDQDPPQGE